MWLYSCYRKRNGMEILQGKKIVYSDNISPMSILLNSNEKIKNAKYISINSGYIKADDKKYYFKDKNGLMELYVGPVRYTMEEVEEHKNEIGIVKKILKFLRIK